LIQKIRTYPGTVTVVKVAKTEITGKTFKLPETSWHNYTKSGSPPSGQTKVVVCKEVCKKINAVNTSKNYNAPSVLMKIQYT
jgi:hypothetical protein